MRANLMILPLLLCAAPAASQGSPADLPSQLTDPGTAERLGRAMQALSQAFLDLPVGEVQAAVEGREPGPQGKELTLRDIGRRDNRNFDRDVQQQIANARPMIEQSIGALKAALPALVQGVEQMQRSLDRAAANMPDPTYPKR